ncbi:hypothetical protein BS636_13500 [Acinetobacter sp. LoGeW2-3]|uniref:hypothetical protein n=1 Tax=Acinetobacter sp. LoGeW2-3 TaxID=1808001 RepID=UPI000C05CA94|nr:hypothetical protein [Acinetobacter sp. LoGeW2-3]ATO20614.1 hypothetical protein BS636_13500 [Acinetobacter sp. LoGeW2-3]
MNLYRITRNDDPSYDEFVGLVVAAKDEESAKQTAYMAQYDHKYADLTLPYGTHFNGNNIQVELIGITDKFKDGYIVLADFLHG